MFLYQKIKYFLLFLSFISITNHCAFLNNAKRIVILGNSGSGKSTLAQQLHRLMRLPVYHLDQYFWEPNWIHVNIDTCKKIHESLCSHNEWIIDGKSCCCLEDRIKYADVVIFLDIPTSLCIARVLKRTIKNYDVAVSSNASECVENINWRYLQFLKGICYFKTKRVPIIMELLSTYSKVKEVYILTSQKEVNNFIKQLENMR